VTVNCPTCGAPGYDPLRERIPPPATSSVWARRQAIAAARDAVDRAKRQRTARRTEEEQG
jgi:hypothetical protein